MDHNSVKLIALHGVFESDHGFLLDGLTAMTSFGYSQMSGSVTSSGSPTEDCWDGNDGAHNFPAGLRVMVVDDDSLCLMIMKRMLQQCNYKVTTCSRAREALSLLRENRNKYDLVISDVYMPDMDGFKLLELIGLEMDLPVIMVSANGETSTVMKGITHGACDYLLKPVRIEELRNIWQHVVRKRVHKDVTKEENSGEWDEAERTLETPKDGLEYTSRKRKEKLELIDDLVDDISGLKKARVVWSGELHRQFVKAVNYLGIEKAVPKRILEIMNVQGLSRENVASHLQKYRLGLKRLSGVNPEPLPVASFQAAKNGEFGGTMRVLPGGTKSSISSTRSLSSGVFGRNMNQLDSGTLKSLAQLKAFQQKPTESTVSQEEWKFREDELYEVRSQRTQSLELRKLLQVQRTKLWQHMNKENNRESYGDKKVAGERHNAAVIRFQQHMEPSGPRQRPGTKDVGRIFGPHEILMRREESAPGHDDDESFDLSKIVEEMGTAISLPSDQTLSYITIPGQQIGNFNDSFNGNELSQLTGSELRHKGQGIWY